MLLDPNPATQVSLDKREFRIPDPVARLLDMLRAAGARTQAAELIERLAAAGRFGLFLQQEGRAEQFRFGREANGRPAKPWALDRPRLSDADPKAVDRRAEASPARAPPGWTRFSETNDRIGPDSVGLGQFR